MFSTTRSTARTMTLTGALALALAACSDSGGAQEEAPAAGASGGVANTERLTIAMITHEAPGDSFWDKIRKGADAAAAKNNVDLKYSPDPQAAGQATLIQNAVDSNVDGIAVTMATPEPLLPAIKAARAKGIPVVAFNSGINQYKDAGAIAYFGSDESLAGQTVGERLTANGAKKVLCVIQAEGSVALEGRCAGVKKGAPSTENIQVNGQDLAAVNSSLTAKLQQDKTIDAVVTLGAPIALAAQESIKGAGSSAKVATFDLNADVAKQIQAGGIDFSVDQQPYVQGHEAIDSLWLNLTNGNDIGGGLPVLTGPSIVDKDNIEAIVPYTEKNTR